jgi:hypothetical protein
MTLKDLSEQLWVIDCSKTKMPPDYVVRTKFSDKTANGLTKAIITFLKLHGCQAERISNTGRYIDDTRIVTDVIGFQRKIGSGKYIKGTGTNGTADISATIRGKSVKIEVKIGKDRQSEAQKKYQDDIERAGGLYWIAKDFTGFIEQFNHLMNDN